MTLNLKFTATKVDEIEQIKKQSIDNCVVDNSISNIVLFIQKGLVDDNGIHGVSRAVALSTIDNYCVEKDKDDLIFDIMEALIRDGFLSREIDLEELKQKKAEKLAQLKEKMKEQMK